jgi:anti-sigma factor ChrR (cupin superfamily)
MWPQFQVRRAAHHTEETNVINLEGVVSANWRELPRKEIFPGVHRCLVWQEAGGSIALVVEFEPGAKFTTLDTHSSGPEEVFVVSGVFNDGVHDYPAGTFIHNPAGSSHVPQSVQGCVIFVFYPQG